MGTLEPGKLANLIVLDRDLFAIDRRNPEDESRCQLF